MPTHLADEEWNELLREEDVFKLAIRGQSAIEAEVDATIAAHFVGDVPKELQRAPPLRIAILIGTGVLPQSFEQHFKAPAKLRNAFAHGEIHSLTRQRARTLLDGIREQIADKDFLEQLATAEPIFTLRLALVTAMVIITASANADQARRQEAKQAIEANRRTIAELLGSDAIQESRSFNPWKDPPRGK